jgi:hypothetical protein
VLDWGSNNIVSLLKFVDYVLVKLGGLIVDLGMKAVFGLQCCALVYVL